jgi:hypothetical protein
MLVAPTDLTFLTIQPPLLAPAARPLVRTRGHITITQQKTHPSVGWQHAPTASTKRSRSHQPEWRLWETPFPDRRLEVFGYSSIGCLAATGTAAWVDDRRSLPGGDVVTWRRLYPHHHRLSVRQFGCWGPDSRHSLNDALPRSSVHEPSRTRGSEWQENAAPRIGLPTER